MEVRVEPVGVNLLLIKWVMGSYSGLLGSMPSTFIHCGGLNENDPTGSQLMELLGKD